MVEVDPDDPAFTDPTKFVGPVYDEAEAEGLAADNGWTVKAGRRHWRRVVATPKPKRIFEIRPMRWLLEQGRRRDLRRRRRDPDDVRAGEERRLVGVEAVIDKDLASSLLARELDADLFVMATDVDGVYATGARRPAPARPGTPEELARWTSRPARWARRSKPPRSSSRPPGKRAAIGSLEQIDGLVAGTAGTNIVPRRRPTEGKEEEQR